MLIFPTIKHTGSHFVIEMFGLHPMWGMNWQGKKYNEGRQGNVDFYFDHIRPGLQHLYVPLIKQHTPIIPLRHPRVTWFSWRDRRKNLQEFVDTWRILVNEIDPCGVYYVPLDSPKRDSYLSSLNDALNMELETDWAPKGVRQNNWRLDYRCTPAPKQVEDLCVEIAPFLQQFYEVDNALFQGSEVPTGKDHIQDGADSHP